MSAASSPVSPTGLVWWDVMVKTEKDGKPHSYFCSFLCLTESEARFKGVHFAQTEKVKVVSVSVALAASPPPGAPPALPPPAATAKADLTDEEKRLIASFVLVPIDCNPTLYV